MKLLLKYGIGVVSYLFLFIYNSFTAVKRTEVIQTPVLNSTYQEEFCASECSPLQEMELADLEKSVQNIVSSLPDKCRFIFEQYLYSNLTPQEIADKNNISVNTVRVHVKNAMDKIREKVGSRVGILLFFLF